MNSMQILVQLINMQKSAPPRLKLSLTPILNARQCMHGSAIEYKNFLLISFKIRTFEYKTISPKNNICENKTFFNEQKGGFLCEFNEFEEIIYSYVQQTQF